MRSFTFLSTTQDVVVVLKLCVGTSDGGCGFRLGVMSEGDLVQGSSSLEPRGNICRDPIDEIRAYNNICYMPPKFHCPLFVHVCVCVCMCHWKQFRQERERERETESWERWVLRWTEKLWERGKEEREKTKCKKEKTRGERTWTRPWETWEVEKEFTIENHIGRVMTRGKKLMED